MRRLEIEAWVSGCVGLWSQEVVCVCGSLSQLGVWVQAMGRELRRGVLAANEVISQGTIFTSDVRMLKRNTSVWIEIECHILHCK